MAMPSPRGQRDPEAHRARMLLSLVPEEIRKSEGNAELARRLNEYQQLNARAHDMSLSAPLRHEAFLRASEVLTAPVAPGRGADARLEGLRQAHRGCVPVGKAKKADKEPPVPVFDADGNLVGICDPDDITLISSPGGSKAAPQPAADADAAAQDPALDGQVIRALPGKVIVRDQYGRRYLTNQRSITPLARGAVRKAADAS